MYPATEQLVEDEDPVEVDVEEAEPVVDFATEPVVDLTTAPVVDLTAVPVVI